MNECSRICNTCKNFSRFLDDRTNTEVFVSCEFLKNKLLIIDAYNKINYEIIKKYVKFIILCPDKSIEYDRDVLIAAMRENINLFKKFINIRPEKKDIIYIIQKAGEMTLFQRYERIIMKEIKDIILEDPAYYILKYLTIINNTRCAYSSDLSSFSSLLSLISSNIKKIENSPKFEHCVPDFLGNLKYYDTSNSRIVLEIVNKLIKLGAKTKFNLHVYLSNYFIYSTLYHIILS